MQTGPIQVQLSNEISPAAGQAFTNLLLAMAIDPNVPFAAEEFFVKLMNSTAAAETALPDNLKQNNFGYSIGEGGNYRATIKAVVQNSPIVIG